MTRRGKLFAAISAVSLPVYIALIVAVALFNVDQLSDLVIEVRADWGKSFYYVVCALYLNLMLWWTCRQTLDFCSYHDRQALDGKKKYFPFLFFRAAGRSLTSPTDTMQRTKPTIPHYVTGIALVIMLIMALLQREFGMLASITLIAAVFGVWAYRQRNKNNTECIPVHYYGGVFGFYLPRALPGIFFLIVIVFAAIHSAWNIALLSLATFVVMSWLLAQRRKLVNQQGSGIWRIRQTWLAIVVLLVIIPTMAALFFPDTFYHIGGLGITLLGLGGIVTGATVVIYGIVIPLWNIVVGLGKQRGFFYVLPPYPVAFSMVTAAVLISIICQTDNHAYRTCSDNACTTVSRPYAGIEQAFEAFKSNSGLRHIEADNGKTYIPVYFIANQGGGLRASYWSNAILSMIEDSCPGFHNNVFLMSGASGGTVGNFTYASAVAVNPTETKTSDSVCNFQRRIEKPTGSPTGADTQFAKTNQLHGEDHLAAVVTSFLYNDLLYRYLPMGWWKNDRAYYLERSFSRAFDNAYGTRHQSNPFRQGYQSLYQNITKDRLASAQPLAYWKPIVLGTTSIQELGLLAMTAPFDFDQKQFPLVLDLQRLQAYHKEYENKYQTKDTWLNFDPIDINPADITVEQDEVSDIPVITAAINSARFPYVTPKGSLHADADWKRKLHTADAGYLDNFGAITVKHAMQALNAQLGKNSDAGPIYMPVLIVFKNSVPPTPPQWYTKCRLPANNYANPHPYRVPDGHSSIALNEILGPLQAFIKGREGHADKRLAELLKYHTEHYGQRDRTLGHLQVIFEYENLNKRESEPPLGWYLSAEARTDMADNAVMALNRVVDSSHSDSANSQDCTETTQ